MVHILQPLKTSTTSSVLASAKTSAPYFGGNVLADLSIPNFYEHFDKHSGRLTNVDVHKQLLAAVKKLA
jgi:chromate reductase, NAD(P)H dehydrogenase (quinone)